LYGAPCGAQWFALMFKNDGDPTLRRAMPALLLCTLVLPLLALVYLFCHFRAIQAPFFLFDGVFQTLSPLRRLMDGQVFYRDFVTYLGIGHTLVYVPLFVLLGQTIYASMFSAHFASCFASGLTLLLLFRCVTKSMRWSVLFTALVMGHAIYNPLNRIVWLATHYLEPGVSGRPLRIFLPTLQMILVLWIWPRLAGATNKMAIRRVLFLAFLGGASLFYSNDYGLPSLAILPLCFILLRPGNPRRGFEFVVYLLAAPLFIFLIGNLLTLGHLGEWFRYNFLWVAKSQFWYFEDYTTKLIQFNDWVNMAEQGEGYKWQLPILLPLLYIAFRRSGSVVSSAACLFFLLLIHFVSAVLVQFGSYRQSGYEMGLTMLYPFVQAYCLYFVACSVPWKKISKKKHLKSGMKALTRIQALGEPAFAVCALAVGLFVCSQYFQYEAVGEAYAETMKLSEEVPLLGRRLDSDRALDVQLLTQVGAKLTTGPVLSEYGGLDMVVWNRRSDSRADLLIHAFGAERDSIADKVRSRSLELISTISPDYNNWQQWSLRANWWFYRPLCENYEVVAASPGFWIWAPRVKPLPRPSVPAPHCEWKVAASGRVHFTLVPGAGVSGKSTIGSVSVRVRLEPLTFVQSKIQRELFLFDFIELPVKRRWSMLSARIGKPVQEGEMTFPFEFAAGKPSRFELSLEGTYPRQFSVESCDVLPIVDSIQVPAAPWLNARFN
jgi:hypothetical protein